MSTPKKHAKFAASSSHRWIACPGSLELSEQAPPQKESSAASEGTKAHELMELALNGNVKDVAKFFKNDDYPKDMLKAVQEFVDYVRAELKPGFELLVEERVQLDFLHPTEAFGTVDVAIIEPFGLLHIIDFKFGYNFVDHNQNTQMLFYGLGLAHKEGFNIEQIKTTIYQPRIVNEDGEVYRSTYYTVDEIKEWKTIFQKAIARAENPDLTKDLNPGEHCKYCPAKIICPAISNKALSSAKLDFDDPVLPEPKELDKKTISQILSKAHYLELWINEVKEYAISEIKNKNKIPGWTLEPTRPQRVWAHDSFYWPFDKIGVNWFESKPKSVAQIEKELKAKKVPQKKIDEFFKANVAHVSSGVKLVQNQTTDYAPKALEKSRRH